MEIIGRFVKDIGSLVSKIVAHMLYFEICFVYYSTRGIGFAIYLIAFAFAFFSQGMDPIRIACWIYVTYLFGLILVLKVAFQFKKIEDWVCREVGAEKVRKKLYNSPLLGSTRLLITGSGISGALEAGTYAFKTAGNLIQTREAVHRIETNANLRVTEIRENTVNKLESLKDRIPDKEYATAVNREWGQTTREITQVRAAEEQAVKEACFQLKPQQGIIGETASAIKDTVMYEHTTKVMIAGIERGTSLAKKGIPWWW